MMALVRVPLGDLGSLVPAPALDKTDLLHFSNRRVPLARIREPYLASMR